MKFSKILIGAALAVAPIAVTISPAGATAAHGPEFEWKYASAGGNFTDCPVGPVASETQCTGINFYAEAFDVQVGETERHVEQGGAQKFTVHLHVGGTFNIDPMPFAGGQGALHVDLEGLKGGSVSGSIPMSDGTSLKVSTKYRFVGPAIPYGETNVAYPNPYCPSGNIVTTYSGAFGAAKATGSVTSGGVRYVPTEANGPASMNTNHEHGICTA